MHVTVTGGCGYIGSVLVPKLIAAGHEVTVIDSMWFGNYLQLSDRLKIIKTDFRAPWYPLGEAVIHLAGVANDPHADLDPKLSWEINALGTMRLADRCMREGVKWFIYASSGSVYGVSKEPEVTEETALDPISEYNKTKMVAERCVLSYAHDMAVTIFRPGTVCGFSPRMRLDVVVNRFTMQAVETGVIKVMGGEQMRPHVHIEDMTDAYVWALSDPSSIGIFNVGFENSTVAAVAEMISSKTGAKIVFKSSDDPRSYRLNSDRILLNGFKPKHTVSDAVDDLIEKWKSGELKNDINWHNIEVMKRAA